MDSIFIKETPKQAERVKKRIKFVFNIYRWD